MHQHALAMHAALAGADNNELGKHLLQECRQLLLREFGNLLQVPSLQGGYAQISAQNFWYSLQGL